MSEPRYVSVTALNRYISYKFDNDENLKQVFLKGEISNFKYSGKHCYFSIKDEQSEISAMFFYPANLTLNFDVVDGMSVLVTGRIQVYQKKGTYAIIVDKMAQEGIGALYQQFLKLKDQLQKEGLFDESRKLPLPEYPVRVAVITAPTGEAIHDIISTFNRRLPLARLKLYPALVQGTEAPNDLIRALNQVYQDNWADVIIIGRGGGSFEDLSCFNDERLVRLLASSKIPTVSAIGHEGDYTICDFVASYRAPTPTGAAMRLTKDYSEVYNTIMVNVKRLSTSIKNCLINHYKHYMNLSSSYVLNHFDEYLDNKAYNYFILVEKLKNLTPLKIAENKENQLINLTKNLQSSYLYQFEMSRNKVTNLQNKFTNELFLRNIKRFEDEVNNLIDKCIILNPFNIMLKGYVTAYQDDHLIKSVDALNKNLPLLIKMADGEVETTINKIKKIKEKA